MPRPRTVTATELERMTPAERDAHFEASVITDLSQVPPAYLDRLRHRVEDRIEHAAQEHTDSA